MRSEAVRQVDEATGVSDGSRGVGERCKRALCMGSGGQMPLSFGGASKDACDAAFVDNELFEDGVDIFIANGHKDL